MHLHCEAETSRRTKPIYIRPISPAQHKRGLISARAPSGLGTSEEMHASTVLSKVATHTHHQHQHLEWPDKWCACIAHQRTLGHVSYFFLQHHSEERPSKTQASVWALTGFHRQVALCTLFSHFKMQTSELIVFEHLYSQAGLL